MFPFLGWKHPSCQDSESLFYSSQQLLLNTHFGFLCFSSSLGTEHTISCEAWPHQAPWDQRGVRQVVVYNVTIGHPQRSHLLPGHPTSALLLSTLMLYPGTLCPGEDGLECLGASIEPWLIKRGKVACPAFVKDAYRAYILLFEFVRSFQSKNLISWLLLFIGNGAGMLSNCFSLVFCSPAFSCPFSTRCLRCGSSQNYPLLSVTVTSTMTKCRLRREFVWLAHHVTTHHRGTSEQVSRQEPGGQTELKEKPQRTLLIGLLFLACSAYFLTEPRASLPGWHHFLCQSAKNALLVLLKTFCFILVLLVCFIGL